MPGHEQNQPVARPRTAGAVLGLRLPGFSTSSKPDHDQSSDAPPQSSTHLTPSIASSSYASFSRSQTSLIGGLSEKLSGGLKASSNPTATPVKSKSRLNLRNPMSLLIRRRSGQSLDPLADESLVTNRSSSNVPPLPDNYDPSIRGHIVHDFNAPRVNRNFSYNNAYTNDQPSQDLGRVSPQKIDREYTPVFREHFDDDTSYEQSQAAIRAEQLANKDFLARNTTQVSAAKRSSPPPPPLPKNPPPSQIESFSAITQPQSQPAIDSSFVLSSSILSPVQEAPSPTDASVQVPPPKRRSTKTPPAARSRAASVTDPSFQPAGLPAHFSSRASRFSFQTLGGSDSAQEKLLEERHKAKAAEKAFKQARMSTNTLDDEYDEYGMDDFDMDDGFDEEIPMLGEEDEFGGLGDQTLDSGINNFDFSSLSVQPGLNDPLSPMNILGQLHTPIDKNGNPIGFAMSGDVLQQLQPPLLQSEQDKDQSLTKETRNPGSADLAGNVDTTSQSLLLDPPALSATAADHNYTQSKTEISDDMYFDDGLIGEQDNNESAEFDENVFDDPSGPLFDRRVKFAPVEDTPLAAVSHLQDLSSLEADDQADADEASTHPKQSQPSLAHQTSIVAHQAAPPFVNKLEAYHSALADAANKAEAAGRFDRKASVDGVQVSSDPDDFSSMSTSRPSLVPDDGRFSLDTTGVRPYDDGFDMSSSFVDDYEYNDFDSALEDDPIIAAANAEALAYDDEGFYGTEFGFYASAVGETPSAWGGFFGPSGVGRTVSGRNAVREPNLTPITERSEYSTRNSLISLSHFRDGQQPLQSPALAQLARMSPYGWPEEEDMSLDSLLKLRKGAFGGSAPSLPVSTSNSPRNSSPMGMQFVPRITSPAGNRMQEHSKSDFEDIDSANIDNVLKSDELEEEDDEIDAVNAAYEDGNSESDGEERPESPTLTSSEYNPASSPTSHLPRKDAQLFHPILEAYGLSNMPVSSQLPLTSPGPISPQGIVLGAPFVPQQRPSAPPSIDTSLSSPSASASTSNAPRRQSLGLISPVSLSSPITPNGGTWKGGHSRKGSAADSVTYVREHDETGEGRWVLERRRTAESGELELIGREIVEGGRI